MISGIPNYITTCSLSRSSQFNYLYAEYPNLPTSYQINNDVLNANMNNWYPIRNDEYRDRSSPYMKKWMEHVVYELNSLQNQINQNNILLNKILDDVWLEDRILSCSFNYHRSRKLNVGPANPAGPGAHGSYNTDPTFP